MVYYLIRFASWLAGKVPRRVRLSVAGAVTELIYFGWLSKRRVTIANMAQILGTSRDDPRARRLARRSWRNFGRYVSDFIDMPNTTREEIVARLQDTTPPPGAFGLLAEALAKGKGAILVSTHFGAYDVAGIAVASRYPLHLIVETIADPRMDRMWQEQRRALGMEVIRIEQSPRQMLRVLQDNGIIAVAVDRPLPPGEGIPVTFFGTTCWVPGGIAQLAVRSGAAIVPGFCVYDEAYSSTYYLGAGPILYPESTGDRKADTARLNQRMFAALEDQIRTRPDQWAMFRAFWPSVPRPSVWGSFAARLRGRRAFLLSSPVSAPKAPNSNTEPAPRPAAIGQEAPSRRHMPEATGRAGVPPVAGVPSSGEPRSGADD